MGVLLLDEQTAPGTPSTGQVVLYPKTDGFLYSKDDAGTETQLVVGGITLGTPVTTTSGTSHDFTIPAGTRRVTVSFSGISSNGTSASIVQLGASGGIEATGYVGAFTVVVNGSNPGTGALSTGFNIPGGQGSAANTFHGSMVLTLLNPSTNLWACNCAAGRGDAAVGGTTGGTKALSDVLTTVRLTTVNGTDTFDAGSVNVAYE